MISVIVCSRKPASWDYHQRNVLKTIGCEHEYLRIDNSANLMGICKAYNTGVQKAKGGILVFMHEDAFFMEPDWGPKLAAKFAADPGIGLVGVAGTQYLFDDNPLWIAAGKPFLRGRVVHELDRGERFFMSLFSADRADADVVVVDGVFMAMPRRIFDTVKFDDETFGHFHFYDLDISMQVRETHRVVVTWDILIKHLSGGKGDADWVEAGKRFLEKYRDRLPASSTNLIPDRDRIEMPQSHDLKGRVLQSTLL